MAKNLQEAQDNLAFWEAEVAKAQKAYDDAVTGGASRGELALGRNSPQSKLDLAARKLKGAQGLYDNFIAQDKVNEDRGGTPEDLRAKAITSLENIPGFYYPQLPAEFTGAMGASNTLYNDLRDDYLSALNFSTDPVKWRGQTIPLLGNSDIGSGVKILYEPQHLAAGQDPVLLPWADGEKSYDYDWKNAPGNLAPQTMAEAREGDRPGGIISPKRRTEGDGLWLGYVNSWVDSVNEFGRRYQDFWDYGIPSTYGGVAESLGQTMHDPSEPWDKGQSWDYTADANNFDVNSQWARLANAANTAGAPAIGEAQDKARDDARVALARMGQLGSATERNLLGQISGQSSGDLLSEHVRNTLGQYGDVLSTHANTAANQLSSDSAAILAGNTPTYSDRYEFNPTGPGDRYSNSNVALDATMGAFNQFNDIYRNAANPRESLGGIFSSLINSFVRGANSRAGYGDGQQGTGGGLTAYIGELIAPGGAPRQVLPRDQEFQSRFDTAGGSYGGTVG